MTQRIDEYDLGINQIIVKLYCDNRSTIHLSKNLQYHNKIKHIGAKLHFVRDKIEKGEVEALKVHT